jgi:hypothetical protein
VTSLLTYNVQEIEVTNSFLSAFPVCLAVLVLLGLVYAILREWGKRLHRHRVAAQDRILVALE